MRRGVAARRRTLMVHLYVPGSTSTQITSTHRSPRFGFVVSKAVGNAVVRHAVTRRLRQVCAMRAHTLPDGACVVVRAFPPAATATSAELDADLCAALEKAHGRLQR
ncbi:ribonuclease P protein component [Corynebacterium aquilae]|uniref:Ribonuclease P protein component n=1 Tax=Corynebacterium aquilae DSM 44791 TaxID=1431546 RepID=A0A1L7CIS3_9CORY|nr:hypothetical protein CAQU_12700 [Corynebacterium aquilae DSM 44791]